MEKTDLSPSLVHTVLSFPSLLLISQEL